jgi:hypothetical protein
MSLLGEFALAESNQMSSACRGNRVFDPERASPFEITEREAVEGTVVTATRQFTR